MHYSKSITVAFALALGAQAMLLPPIPRADAVEADEAWYATITR
jgi:hypothetical protein